MLIDANRFVNCFFFRIPREYDMCYKASRKKKPGTADQMNAVVDMR
jgi:hypothetical protein